MMQAVTELDFVLSNVFVTLTTVTVAASAAPGGTMVEDDRLRILARFRKNMRGYSVGLKQVDVSQSRTRSTIQ